MARIRLETAGALPDRDRARRLDAEIDESLHLPLGLALGLGDLADGLASAAAAMPRLPPALRASAVGALLTGELTIEQAAGRSGRTAPELRRALRAMGLDRLVPAG
jgi:hypothetical protein